MFHRSGIKAIVIEQIKKADDTRHVSCVDIGGHGYAVARVTIDNFETNFIAFLGRSSVVRAPTEAHQGGAAE